MLKRLSYVFLSVSLGVSVASAAGESTNTKRKTRANDPVQIKVVPVGLTQEALDQLKLQVERSAAVQKELRGANYNLISLEYLETKETRGADAPERFRIVFYDYTNERAIVAEGAIAAPESVRVYEDSAKPPDASVEEFDAATRLIEQNPDFASAVKLQKAFLYRPMPPTSVSENGERLINVGIEPRDSSVKREVVGVSIKRGEIIRYPNNAPPTSKAAPDACGISPAGQQTTSNGTAGQYQMTITQNGVILWELLVIRPSASSGTRKSGIELRDVKYRGKSVLKRGHAPVLNVEYTPSVCGPYRDWQWQEGMFETPAGSTDPAPGIRIAPPGMVARTALENGTDTGNFRGVAIYTQDVGLGPETVLVSEMEAGWYRYIMEWRLANDGTIRPRYGFGATDNSCVCSVHNHHVYWRFDFDVVNPENKVYQVERGRKYLKPITTELTMLRSYQTNRSLLVQNASGDEAYMLTPNISDGRADNYGRSDLWVLRYKNVPGGSALQNEIDDGWNSTGGTCTATSGSCINISPFINGESVEGQDSVIWYGAHFIHSDGSNLLDPNRSGLVLTGSHVVGPDLRPVRW